MWIFAALAATAACSRSRPGQPDAAPPPGPRVRVRLAPDALAAPFSGRLIVLADDRLKGELVRPSDQRSEPPLVVMARDVELAPGGEVVLDARELVELPETRYRFEAVLDANGDYAVAQAGAGDVIANAEFANLPFPGDEITLVLRRVVRAPLLRPPRGVELVRVKSELLAGAKAPQTELVAAAALPPSTEAGPPPPVLYEILDHGGTPEVAVRAAAAARKRMEAGTYPPMVYVMVSATTPTGHSGLAASQCLGPWDRAFVEELVPAVEKAAPVDPKRRAIAGHGAGGRAALRLIIEHPALFAGAWATAPEWPDLRDVLGASFAPGSSDSFFTEADGTARTWRRPATGRARETVDAALRREELLGGGRFASLERRLSPCGRDGRAAPAVDRATGKLVEETLRAWQEADLTRRFAAAWPRAGAELYGKLHLIVGEDDDYQLERSAKLFCARLAELEAGARCEVLPGRGHRLRGLVDPVPEDVAPRMMTEIAAALAP